MHQNPKNLEKRRNLPAWKSWQFAFSHADTANFINPVPLFQWPDSEWRWPMPHKQCRSLTRLLLFHLVDADFRKQAQMVHASLGVVFPTLAINCFWADVKSGLNSSLCYSGKDKKLHELFFSVAQPQNNLSQTNIFFDNFWWYFFENCVIFSVCVCFVLSGLGPQTKANYVMNLKGPKS